MALIVGDSEKATTRFSWADIEIEFFAHSWFQIQNFLFAWHRPLIWSGGVWQENLKYKIQNCFHYLPFNETEMAKIRVDLHDIYNNSDAIDRALLQAFEDAIDKKIREVEIIPGKGSGQLRKKVERFLQLPHIKPLYHRIENDSKNFGRLFVYFKF